jgi:hypothetical protein
VGRGLGAGLIPHPRSPTNSLRDPYVKKEIPTPEKGIRKKEKEEEEEEGYIYFCHDFRHSFLARGLEEYNYDKVVVHTHTHTHTRTVLAHSVLRGAAGWTIGVFGIDSRWGLGIFIFTTASRTALGPTQLPIQWVPGALSLGVKRLGREADHSLPSSAEVKNAWSCTSAPQYVFMAWCLVNHRDNLLYFTLLYFYTLTQQ